MYTATYIVYGLILLLGNKIICYTCRLELIMATKCALKLSIKGRGFCHYQINDRLYHIVELFLLLCGKIIANDDQEIELLMSKECNILVYVRELIQAIISSKKFGAYGKTTEEIKVF